MFERQGTATPWMWTMVRKGTKLETKYVLDANNCCSVDLQDLICQMLVDGATLTDCASEIKVHKSTILRWISHSEDFAKKYRLARQMQAEVLVDQMMNIANDGTNDYTTKLLSNGEEVEVVNSEHIQRSRLRIDTIKWVAGKFAPRVYGDHINVNHSGGVTATLVVMDAPADKS